MIDNIMNDLLNVDLGILKEDQVLTGILGAVLIQNAFVDQIPFNFLLQDSVPQQLFLSIFGFCCNLG